MRDNNSSAYLKWDVWAVFYPLRWKWFRLLVLLAPLHELAFIGWKRSRTLFTPTRRYFLIKCLSLARCETMRRLRQKLHLRHVLSAGKRNLNACVMLSTCCCSNPKQKHRKPIWEFTFAVFSEICSILCCCLCGGGSGGLLVCGDF